MQNLSQPSCTVRKADGWRADDRPLRQREEFVFRGKLGLDHALPPRHAQLRQAVIALRPDDEIDHWRAVDDLASFGLRHATRDHDHGVEAACFPPLFHRAHPAKLGIDLLGRLLADMAGIKNDELGLFELSVCV